MAYILFIDTSAQQGSVAIAEDRKLISKRINDSERDHAATINVNMDAVLAEAEIFLNAIDAVAVIGGPGSYTGLRIGLATAKGLCYALQKPLLMHNRLDLMAVQLMETQPGYENYMALLPARQDEFFITVYHGSGNCTYPAQHMHRSEVEQLFGNLQGSTVIAGKDTDFLFGSFRIVETEGFSEDVWYRKAHGDFLDSRFADLASASPFYLKSVYTTQKKAD